MHILCIFSYFVCIENPMYSHKFSHRNKCQSNDRFSQLGRSDNFFKSKNWRNTTVKLSFESYWTSVKTVSGGIKISVSRSSARYRFPFLTHLYTRFNVRLQHAASTLTTSHSRHDASTVRHTEDRVRRPSSIQVCFFPSRFPKKRAYTRARTTCTLRALCAGCT